MRAGRVWCALAGVVALFETVAGSMQSRAIRPIRDPTGVAWLIFVDDLHIDFRNTGYLRQLLKSIASDVIRPGDVVAVRSTGPSNLAIDLTSDRAQLDAAIGRTSGAALKEADILATPGGRRGNRISREGHGERGVGNDRGRLAIRQSAERPALHQ